MFVSPQPPPLAPLKTSAKVTPGRCASLASVQGQRHLPVLPIPDPWEVRRVLAFHSWMYLQCTTFSHSPTKPLPPSCVIRVAPTKELVPELNTNAVKSGASMKPTATSLMKMWCQKTNYISLNSSSTAFEVNCQVGATFWLIVLYPKGGTS